MVVDDDRETGEDVADDRATRNDPPPSLTIDWELYATYLEDSDMNDEQKYEFIQTLWNIVTAFVDLGFGVHPFQQACEQPAVAGTAEQKQKNDKDGIFLSDDLLQSLDTNKDNLTSQIAVDATHHAQGQEES